MAENFKVLGSAAPGAGVEGTLLTVPANTQDVVATLTICNTGAATTFRVAVAPNGTPTATRHHVYFDAAIGPNVTVAVTIGMTLAAADQLRVQSASGSVAFNAFGTEVTP